jgi:hypothetical protein
VPRASPLESQAAALRVFHSYAVVGINTTALIEQPSWAGPRSPRCCRTYGDAVGDAQLPVPARGERRSCLGRAFRGRACQSPRDSGRNRRHVRAPTAPRFAKDLVEYVAHSRPKSRPRRSWPPSLTAGVMGRTLPRHETQKRAKRSRDRVLARLTRGSGIPGQLVTRRAARGADATSETTRPGSGTHRWRREHRDSARPRSRSVRATAATRAAQQLGQGTGHGVLAPAARRPSAARAFEDSASPPPPHVGVSGSVAR